MLSQVPSPKLIITPRVELPMSILPDNGYLQVPGFKTIFSVMFIGMSIPRLPVAVPDPVM